jgi:hypothetical protein
MLLHQVRFPLISGMKIHNLPILPVGKRRVGESILVNRVQRVIRLCLVIEPEISTGAGATELGYSCKAVIVGCH